MNDVKGFCMGWVAGPSAQVELFSPLAASGGGYQIKYTPPFRSTIRPPVAERPLGPERLDPIKQSLDQLVKKLKGRSPTASGAVPPSPAPADDVLADMELLGGQLLTDPARAVADDGLGQLAGQVQARTDAVRRVPHRRQALPVAGPARHLLLV